MDFDSRDSDDTRDDERWGYDCDLGSRGPPATPPTAMIRDPFVVGLDLPHGVERELVGERRG